MVCTSCGSAYAETQGPPLPTRFRSQAMNPKYAALLNSCIATKDETQVYLTRAVLLSVVLLSVLGNHHRCSSSAFNNGVPSRLGYQRHCKDARSMLPGLQCTATVPYVYQKPDFHAAIKTPSLCTCTVFFISSACGPQLGT
jgi:hypothetical protein